MVLQGHYQLVSFIILPCVCRFVGRQELEAVVKDLKYWVMCRLQEMGNIPVVNVARLVGEVAPDPSSPIVQVRQVHSQHDPICVLYFRLSPQIQVSQCQMRYLL